MGLYSGSKPKVNTMDKNETDKSVNGFKRHVATKVLIRQLLEGEYIQESDFIPNYLLTANQQRIYRLNVMAAILQKEMRGSITDLYLDDGTGKIAVRSFEDDSSIRQLSVGEIVMVIGRLRIYAQERYIAPEIISKVSPSWLKVRSLELGLADHSSLLPNTEELLVPPLPQQDNAKKDALPRQKMVQLIMELDRGEGVAVQDLLERSPLEGAEGIIERMLQSGEIFQISPGRVKIL